MTEHKRQMHLGVFVLGSGDRLKTFKYTRQFFRRNTLPSVHDVYPNEVAVPLGTDRNAIFRCAILDRVIQQVHQHALQVLRVGQHIHRIDWRVQLHCNVLHPCHWRGGFHGFLQFLTQRTWASALLPYLSSRVAKGLAGPASGYAAVRYARR